jgi:hypothetical protein
MTLWNARSAVKAGTLKIYKDLVSWLFNFCTLLMLGSVIRMWSHWIEKLPDRPPIAAVDTANYKANYDRLMPALDLSLGHGVMGAPRTCSMFWPSSHFARSAAM